VITTRKSRLLTKQDVDCGDIHTIRSHRPHTNPRPCGEKVKNINGSPVGWSKTRGAQVRRTVHARSACAIPGPCPSTSTVSYFQDARRCCRSSVKARKRARWLDNGTPRASAAYHLKLLKVSALGQEIDSIFLYLATSGATTRCIRASHDLARSLPLRPPLFENPVRAQFLR